MFSFLTPALPVLLPLIFIIAAEWAFFRFLRRREGSIDFFEIGVLYSVIVLIYAVFPGIEFLSGGLSFSVLADYRLYRAQPSPGQLAPIFWYYALYLACFVFSYRTYRGSQRWENRPISGLDQKLLWFLVGGYVCTYVFFGILTAFWKLTKPETYGETYLIHKDLPPVMEQMANHMVGVAALLQLLLMAFLVLNYRKYKRYIFWWLVIEFVSIAVFGVGMRTGLMVLLLSLIVTYNRFVKRLSMRMVTSLGVALLLLFIGLGLIRGLPGSADEAGFSWFGSRNEFDSLFANAYDLRELKAARLTDEIFPRFYFADLIRVVPEQLIPHGQMAPSQWYVQTFYPDYAEQGGGFAFGAIPECIVGLGWVDVIWRGVLVGWIFGALHRLFVSGERTFFNYAFYLWATVFSYQTFRVTTFNLLPRAVWMLFLWWFIRFLLPLFHTPQSTHPGYGQGSRVPARSRGR
jgi:hypothetical protein